uniref:Ribulose-phosphate 3-epimerase n=1 Tax=Macrostomum lignano TaxID=282301 RepID=A0A1I8FK06_9PLAT
VHMMVSKPRQWVQPMASAGPISTHSTWSHSVKSAPQVAAATLLRQPLGMLTPKLAASAFGISERMGCEWGLGISPDTPVHLCFPLWSLLTSNDGASRLRGQSFMSDMMPKVKSLRDRYATLDIEVDGGVTPDNVATGANVLVSGTALIKSPDPAAVVARLKSVYKS